VTVHRENDVVVSKRKRIASANKDDFCDNFSCSKNMVTATITVVAVPSKIFATTILVCWQIYEKVLLRTHNFFFVNAVFNRACYVIQTSYVSYMRLSLLLSKQHLRPLRKRNYFGFLMMWWVWIEPVWDFQVKWRSPALCEYGFWGTEQFIAYLLWRYLISTFSLLRCGVCFLFP